MSRKHRDLFDDRTPTVVSERKPLTLPLALLFSLLGAAAAAGFGYAMISTKLDAATVNNGETRKAVESNAERIRTLEQAQIKVAEMARDVEWIKRTMEDDRRARGLSSTR